MLGEDLFIGLKMILTTHASKNHSIRQPQKNRLELDFDFSLTIQPLIFLPPEKTGGYNNNATSCRMLVVSPI